MERRGQPAAQRDPRLRRASSNSVESISAQQLQREHREQSASHKRSSGSIGSDRLSIREASQEPISLDSSSPGGRGLISLTPRTSKPLIRAEDVEAVPSESSSSRRAMPNGEGSSKRLVRSSSKISSDGGKRETGVAELEAQIRDQREFISKIQASVSCSICVQLLHEPFTTACGHTFCYGWFEQNKSCPDCRRAVVAQPAPAFIVKDIVSALVSKPGLLNGKDSVKEHLDHRKEASEQLEQDKANDELFRGYFRWNNDRRQVIRDEADRVDRCPFDGYEIEDGVCGFCHRAVGDDGFMFENEYVDMDDDMLENPFGLWGEGPVIDLDSESVGEQEDDYDYDDEELDEQLNYLQFPAAVGPRRAAHSAAAGRARREQTASTFDSEMMTVDEEEEGDEDEDEDGSSESMDGFIVRDEDASPDGSDESSSENDEDGDASMDDTTRFDNQPDTSDSEPPIPRARGRGANSRAPIVIPDDDDEDEDDDDEGGAISNGRRRRHAHAGAAAQGYVPLDLDNMGDSPQRRRRRRAEGSVTPTPEHPTPNRPTSRTGRAFSASMRRGTARSGRVTPQRMSTDEDGDVDMQLVGQSRNGSNRPRLSMSQSTRARQARPAHYNPDLEQLLAQHVTQLSSASGISSDEQAWNMLDRSRTPSSNAYTIMRPRTANRRRSSRNLAGQATTGQQNQNTVPGHQRQESVDSVASQSSASSYGYPSFPMSHGLMARANSRTPNLRSPPQHVGLVTPDSSASSAGPMSPARPASRQRIAPSPVQSPTSFWANSTYVAPVADRNPWASQRTHARLHRQASNNGLRPSQSRRDLRSQTPTQLNPGQPTGFIRPSPSSQRLRPQGSNARLRASAPTPSRQQMSGTPSGSATRPLRASNPWYNFRNNAIEESSASRSAGEGYSEPVAGSSLQGSYQNAQHRSAASPVLRKRVSNRSMGINRTSAASPGIMYMSPSWPQRNGNALPTLTPTAGSNSNYQFLFPSNRGNSLPLAVGGASTRQ